MFELAINRTITPDASEQERVLLFNAWQWTQSVYGGTASHTYKLYPYIHFNLHEGDGPPVWLGTCGLVSPKALIDAGNFRKAFAPWHLSEADLSEREARPLLYVEELISGGWCAQLGDFSGSEQATVIRDAWGRLAQLAPKGPGIIEYRPFAELPSHMLAHCDVGDLVSGRTL